MSPTALKIGDLRHRILFQAEIPVDDQHHGHTIIWKDVATVWALVEPVSGREFFYSQQLKNTITHKIKIRFRSDINVELRIVFGTRIMKIESMINIQEGDRFMELRCIEDM